MKIDQDLTDFMKKGVLAKLRRDLERYENRVAKVKYDIAMIEAALNQIAKGS